MHSDPIISHTKIWIEKFVIGLDLCPFAAPPYFANKISYILNDEDASLPIVNSVLEASLKLQSSNEIETCFIITPSLRLEFESFYHFVHDIQVLIDTKKIEIKLVAFHPGFKYADSDSNNTSNATNQSPYPMIHLLRKSSLQELINSSRDLNQIPLKNQKLLSAMTWDEIRNIIKL